MERVEGFLPVYAPDSRVLILGSFPSVKSRAIGFYYGHPQNRFWRTVCSFFEEEVPPTVEGKQDFLLRRGIALWDVVASCEIVGSQDATIEKEEVARLPDLVEKCGAKIILCNGKKAFEILGREYPQLYGMTRLLPSTSPANPRFSREAWHGAFREIYYDHIR